MQTKSTPYVLDSGAIGTSREPTVDEDASGKADLAVETLVIELVRKGSRRHCWVVGRLWGTIGEEADFIHVGAMTCEH
jgi:hypothetical protein